mmetsp:Transcript_24533/g.36002  ORF Transcript_24533/g.36002 Transcript_24533/m.36002 type:complete len:313 (-) Transcript_24533:790-1728(-)
MSSGTGTGTIARRNSALSLNTSGHPIRYKLHITNYLNVVGYILRFIITFVGVGGEKHATVLARNQTIFTPSGWTFSIWGLILTTEAIFVFLQLLPDHRRLPVIKKGIGYWFFTTCILEIVWKCLFSYEYFFLSSVFMLFTLASLITIVSKQSEIPPDGTIQDYWLLRAPFSIHCGWIMFYFALEMNLLAVNHTKKAWTQIEWAIVSLAYLTCTAIYTLIWKRTADVAIVLPIAWGTFGVALELTDPTEKINKTFGNGSLTTIQVTSATLCGGILCIAIIKVTIMIFAKHAEQYEDKPEPKRPEPKRDNYSQV